MQIRTIQPCFLLALALLCGNSAKADYLNWSYSTEPSVAGVSAGGAGGSSGGTVQLTEFTNQAGGTSIPVIAYTTASASTSPVTFNPSSSTYSLAMTITDNSTHDSGSLTFTGAVGGTLSATTSTLNNSFVPSPNSLTLDGHKYTVTIPSLALASPTSPQQNILASVSVSNVTEPPVVVPRAVHPFVAPQTFAVVSTPTTSTPEPGSIILACLGIAFMGTSGVRRSLQRSVVG
jgi:hypothetical protein